VKLLFIIHSLKFGGAERQLVELIKGLNQQQYDICLICIDNTTEGYTDLLMQAGIEIRYFCRSFKYDLRPVYSIYRYIRENKIDLVHTFENLGSLFGLSSAKLAGKPVVCSAIRNSKDKNFKLQISIKILSRFADIFVSNSLAGFVNRFSRIKSHFRVVYNGVEFKRFEKKKVNILKIKKDIGIIGFKHVIGMVASLSDHKDHETLLNAIPMVLQKYPEICLLLIGDGRQREKLKSTVRRMGLNENVYFLGYRNDVDEVIQIFNIAVLLTNSDIILEGISNAILEAMAVGIPVIASEGGGTNEIIKNNITGILVKPKRPEETAKAIIDLLGDKKKAKKISDSAKISVRQMFNLQKYVKNYEKIYRELIPF